MILQSINVPSALILIHVLNARYRTYSVVQIFVINVSKVLHLLMGFAQMSLDAKSSLKINPNALHVFQILILFTNQQQKSAFVTMDTMHQIRQDLLNACQNVEMESGFRVMKIVMTEISGMRMDVVHHADKKVIFRALLNHPVAALYSTVLRNSSSTTLTGSKDKTDASFHCCLFPLTLDSNT